MSIPKVFISYSHDDLEHKKWVNNLASQMRNNGIDAILDQWDLMPGSDLPQFMETNLEKADYILMICTERYVEKANQGQGGVGYEKMIITSNLIENIDEKKIIPVIRQKGSTKTPTFLKTKLYLNFSKSSDFEFNFDELIRTIHNSPLLKKPKIGNNPFKETRDIEKQKSNDGLSEVMKIIANQFNLTSDKYILYNNLVYESQISRIYLDLIIKEGIELGYLERDKDGDIILLDKGKHYVVENDLV